MLNKGLFIVVLLCLAGGAFGLDLQRGKLKLVINERTGRYSLYGSEDTSKPTWTPLFLAEDPTTSKWKVMVGDKTYVLGDDSAFTTTVDTTSTGAKVVWSSKFLVATLTFDFILSATTTSADGVRLALTLVNVADATSKVGARWVLDTNLGEKKDHFRLASGEVINAEAKWEGSFPDWWMSPSATDDQLGLLVMVGKISTPPARMYFANWKRLDDSTWDFAVKPGRDFNQLPYSFNDSAVAQVYDAVDLPSGSTREINIVLGLKSAKTFDGARVGSANPIDDLLKKGQDPSLGAMDQDLASLQTLLNQIDAKIGDPNRVSQEDLKLLQAVLDQLAAKRKALEATKP